ncbi:MAG: tetratricopeptide repeat protein [Spirochaetaceae bacterium]|jgi:tetratricopeptide (TPR) repeat protein|nr:tetratricopeptide repeat protein [Spirochaetaceae bacterium]
MYQKVSKFFPGAPLFVCAVLLAQGCASPPPSEPPPAQPEAMPAPATERFIDRLAALLGAGDIDGALALFDTLNEEEAALRQNRRLLASVLLSAGKLDEARKAALALVAEDASDVESRFVLSKIEGAAGVTKEQRRLLEGIVDEDAGHVPALNDLGLLSINKRSLREAAAFFDRALEADPESLDALHGRANVFRLERRADEAEPLYDKVVSLYPGRAESYSARGRFYRENGRMKEALADLDAAKALDGGSYWTAYDRGRVLLEIGRKREALQEFDAAIERGPGVFIAYVYSAGIRDELGDVDGAERDYAALAALRPDYYFAFEGLGIQKMKKGLYGEAALAFETAYRTAPAENSYAMLATINRLKGGEKPHEVRPFVEKAMRKIGRDRLDYYVMRLFYDFSGEADVTRRIDSEKNERVKAQMLFYLASYYDISGLNQLADKFFVEFRDMRRLDLVEWRLNEWILGQRGIHLGGGGTKDAAGTKKG